MDRLQGMEVFVKVAQLGGLSSAATQLGLAKSTVSKHLSALEERLGARLLNRTTRKLALTEAGEIYLERALTILASIEETETALTCHSLAPRGRLRVNAPMTFGQTRLTPLLASFIQTYPEIRIELTLNDRRVDVIDEGFDLVVRIGRLEDSSLMARRLMSAPMICAASPAYLAARGEPLAPQDLRRHTCLRYTYSTTPGEWIFNRDGTEERVRIEGGFSANNGDALTIAAAAGLGVAYGPDFTLEPFLQDGRLKPILCDWRGRTVDVHAVFPPQRPLPLKLRALIDFLVDELGDSR